MSPVRVSQIKDGQTKLLIAVLCGSLSFGLGIYVGKQFSDAQKVEQEKQARLFEQQHSESSIKQEIEAITKMLEEVNRANEGR